jgi:hypothetical protein
LIQTTCHPDAPVAGPGAEAFKERRRNFFGTLAAGKSVEEVLDDMAEQGLPFVDVGLDSCGGIRKIEQKNGTIIDPPCIGQLECNPMQCSNAIITKMHIPIWQKMYSDNMKRLNDSQMAHARLKFERHIAEARRVLQELGVQVG